MKILKIILLFSVLVYLFVFNYFDIYFTDYKEGYISDSFKILDIEISENKISIYTNDILINYYCNNIEELNSLKDLKLGDTVLVEGSLEYPTTNTVFNLFNYKNYLKSKKIYFVLNASSISLNSENKNIFYKFKNETINYINNNPNYKYLNTFILGNNNYIDDSVKNSYNINGISHLFAISGMHVSLLSLILKKVIKNHYILSLFLIFFSFLAGFTASVIRAVSLFIFSKYINIKDLILIVFSIFIILNPFIIYDTGFIFSFIITFYIIYFYKQKSKNYFLNLFNMSLFCFIVSIPILLKNYFYLNFLSPVLNLIFVPLVSLILFPITLLSLIIKIDLTFIYNLFENLSLYLSNYNLIFSFKYFNIYIILLYYLIITFCIIKRNYLILILTLIIHININKFDNNNYLTMIDVGQGDSFLLELNDTYFLVDTGGIVTYDTWYLKTPYNMAYNKLIPYIRSRGINKLDYLVLTHGDNDHLGEAINLLEDFKVNKILLNNNELKDKELEIVNNYKNYMLIDTYNIKSKNFEINFINTNKTNENDASLTFLLTVDNKRLLFTGDISSEVEKELINSFNLSNIDYLKVAHHGSNTSTSTEFIKEINPKISLISAGLNNRYNHPSHIVLEILKQSIIYQTNINNSVLINITKNKIKTIK